MVEEVDLVARIASDPRALPRLATLIENEDSRGLSILDALNSETGNAHIVGITGPPGVGKSELIAALVSAARAGGRRVAVLAIDPSSPYTGGAVLGDRIRMMRHHHDPDVFVRSMATRGRMGGLAWATAGVAHLLDAVGFPLILIETIGTGQDGVDIAAMAQTVVIVAAPGLGDGVQAMKSGQMESGDIVVVNKADRAESEETIRTLRVGISLAAPANNRLPPVLATVATSGEGVAELLREIDEHRAWLASTGLERDRRRDSARSEILAALRHSLDRRLTTAGTDTGPFAELIDRVARRELTARAAIALIEAALAEPLSLPATGRRAIGDQSSGRPGADAVVDIDDHQPGRA